MRIPPKLVEVIAFRLARMLVENEYVQARDINHMEETIEKALLDELSIEDRLDEEVRQILSRYSDEIQRSSAEYHELFKKVKLKLAKERGIVL